MKEEKSYNLYNKQGCLAMTTEATSYNEAREVFQSQYSGLYTIVWYEHDGLVKREKNVRFK